MRGLKSQRFYFLISVDTVAPRIGVRGLKYFVLLLSSACLWVAPRIGVRGLKFWIIAISFAMSRSHLVLGCVD